MKFLNPHPVSKIAEKAVCRSVFLGCKEWLKTSGPTDMSPLNQTVYHRMI